MSDLAKSGQINPKWIKSVGFFYLEPIQQRNLNIIPLSSKVILILGKRKVSLRPLKKK